jgi:hypothetical protein
MTKINSKILKSKFIKTNSKKQTSSKQSPKEEIKRYDVLFDLDHLKYLLNGNNFMVNVPIYMNKFFFRYGSDIFFDNGETFELLTRQEAMNKIPDQYKKQVVITQNNGKEKTIDLSLKSYFGHELFLKTPETKLTIDYNQDYKFTSVDYIKGFDVEINNLNMKKDLPRNYNKVVELTEENKKGVKMFFDHIKNVICSGDLTEYDTVKKFFASCCVGHKLKFALLWQSKEQTGKGTVLNFINELLGKRMVKTSSIENVERYTKIFEGASLINLDELPVSGTSKTLQDTLKALITEPTFDCRAMFNQGYIQKNTFNIVITSNNNCISLTQTNQIRYYVNTISEQYIGKDEYFKELYKYINKEDIKILIFQEFIKIFNEEVKPNNWIGTNLTPTTAGKLKRLEALPPFYKYIKETYILNGLGIDDKCSDFIQQYQNTNKFDKSTSNKLARYLADIGVEVKDVKRTNPETKKQERVFRKYFITFEKLKDAYNSKGWFDELVDEIPEEEKTLDDCKEEDENPLDHGIDYKFGKPKTDEKDEIIDRQNKEIEELKAKLKQLEEQLKPKEKEYETYYVKGKILPSVGEKVNIYLPYKYKKIAKSLGAKYDKDHKVWYVVEGCLFSKFLIDVFKKSKFDKSGEFIPTIDENGKYDNLSLEFITTFCREDYEENFEKEALERINKKEISKHDVKEQLNFDNIEDMINKSTKKASKAKRNKSTKVKEEPKEEDVETDDEDIKNFMELAKDYF